MELVYRLYSVPYQQFSLQPLYSVLLIIVGAIGIGIGLGIYEEFKETFLWQMVGVVYTSVCFAGFVYGFSQDRLKLPHNQ